MFAPTHVSPTCRICGGLWGDDVDDLLDRYVPIVEPVPESLLSHSRSIEHGTVHDDAPGATSASGAAQERCGDT
jgi:hypothetical protein